MHANPGTSAVGEQVTSMALEHLQSALDTPGPRRSPDDPAHCERDEAAVEGKVASGVGNLYFRTIAIH